MDGRLKDQPGDVRLGARWTQIEIFVICSRGYAVLARVLTGAGLKGGSTRLTSGKMKE